MKKTSSPKGRDLTHKVKTAKGRKSSSTRWLQRQLNDPYVQSAKIEGYRSRAAYKLLQIDEKFKILKPGTIVVDLGAAPGGWSQVAVPLVHAPKNGRVIGVDILDMDELKGVDLIKGDFEEDATWEQLEALIGTDKVDVVMSDMAPNTMGHQETDHLRIINLCEIAFEFAEKHLKPGGAFITKLLHGSEEHNFMSLIKKHFTKVKNMKPEASRKGSAETYLVGIDFKG